mgnify:CR=1 FL=1
MDDCESVAQPSSTIPSSSYSPPPRENKERGNDNRVRFAGVRCRWYEREQGGSCSIPTAGGYSLGLSWKVRGEGSLPSVDEHDAIGVLRMDNVKLSNGCKVEVSGRAGNNKSGKQAGKKGKKKGNQQHDDSAEDPGARCGSAPSGSSHLGAKKGMGKKARRNARKKAQRVLEEEERQQQIVTFQHQKIMRDHHIENTYKGSPLDIYMENLHVSYGSLDASPSELTGSYSPTSPSFCGGLHLSTSNELSNKKQRRMYPIHEADKVLPFLSLYLSFRICVLF